jgi:hypothetical protein
MSDNRHDMSWRGIGILWVTACLLFAFTYQIMGCGKVHAPSPEAERQAAEFKERLNALQANLEHPKVKAAFQAGYALGMHYKASGLAKLNEPELDPYAIAACQELEVPDEVIGHAMRKFKAGYGWGFFGGQ